MLNGCKIPGPTHMSDFSSSNTSGYLSDPDVHLMLEFQKGDKASFETLMHKYYGRVLNFVFRFTGRKDIAEDLTQDVFMKVYLNGHTYKPQAKFQTWLFTIARNVSLNEMRKASHKDLSLDNTFEDEDGASMAHQVADEKAVDPGRKMLEEEKAALIQQAIQELPENQRTAVLLRRYEDFSYEEIARTMRCSAEAVKSLLNRAKESLKVRLERLVRD